MGSKEAKNEKWHLRKMTWTQETGNKELQVKNWHLKKNDWKKIGNKKKSRKRLASWENGSEPKNGKQKTPIEKLAPIKMIGTKNSEAKRSTKKSDT